MSLLKLLLVYVLLYLLTFTLILPFLCNSWVYSWYFDEAGFDEPVERLLKVSNDKRINAARSYLSDIQVNNSKMWHQRRLDDGALDLLVVVKTVDRSTLNDNPPVNYLLQTMVRLDREIRTSDSPSFRVGLVMCNADPKPSFHEDAVMLSKFYPSVSVVHDDRHRSPWPHVRELEKLHLVGCLRSVANISTRYLLMVEDDAEPYTRVFFDVKSVLADHVESRMLRGERVRGSNNWAFLKLYYPERWSGYSNSILHVCELFGIGCIVGALCAVTVISWNHPRTVPREILWLHVMLGACYGILLAMTVGRQHLLQLRRMGTGIVMVGEAPGCCTPAVLYPRRVIGPVIKFLSKVTCTESYGVDLALDNFSEISSLHRFLVEPNFFHHRGVYSTLTKPKNMVEFLFDS